MIARLAAALAAALVLGLGTGVVAARKAPPPMHRTVKHKPKRHRAPARHRKPAAKKPAAAPVVPGAPAQTVPVPEPPVTADPAPAETTPADQTPAATPLSRALGVTEREFSLSLSRTVVGAGTVTVQVLNRGEDAHDLRIDAAGGGPVEQWDELPALSPAVAKSVTLAPGTYRLYCTLPGHAAAGMDKQITVLAG